MKTIRFSVFSLLFAFAAFPAAALVYSTGLTGFNVNYTGLGYAETGSVLRIVAQGDFDGNGSGDLMFRNMATGQVTVSLFSGTTASPARTVYSEPNMDWRIIGTADFNGDGRTDIVWRNITTGLVWGMLLDGVRILGQGPIHHEPNRAWRIKAIGDFAGSSFDHQILWSNSESGDVYLHTVTWSNGAFVTTGRTIYREPLTAWEVVGAADFDGDGRSDILYRNNATGVVWVLLMNGDVVKAQGPIHRETDLDWKVVGFSDYNGDDRADVLWRHDRTGEMQMLQVNGLLVGDRILVQQGPTDVPKLGGAVGYPQPQ